MAKEEKGTNVQNENEAKTMTPEEMDVMREAMKAELKAELMAEMQAEQPTNNKAKSKPMTKKEIEYWNEPVEYSAPFIEGAEDDIVVGHNGILYKIRRGETVEIPRKVRQVLLDSEKQKMEFAKLKKGLENQEL